MTIIPPLPNNIQDGTTGDAVPVMGNFNAIVNATNTNGAHNGANSDITSLSGLTTPLSIAQGGTNQNATPAAQLPGSATNDTANAGNLGEYISSTLASGSALPISSGVPLNITSISLTAGDWDVSGSVASIPSPSASIALQTAAISQVSATLPTLPNAGGSTLLQIASGFGAQAGQIICCGPMRISLATTTTVYLVAQINILSSTCTAYGFIGARRAR